ncbi:hypothetical protein FACS1894164_19290 [Spirochaetia bacterium]|nr:hypothetical protein FACS1894164_19290 [Spirochaetia bacterium]
MNEGTCDHLEAAQLILAALSRLLPAANLEKEHAIIDCPPYLDPHPQSLCRVSVSLRFDLNALRADTVEKGQSNED